MRDSNDKHTLNIDGLPGLPGRPATGKAKTAKERQRDYQNRKEIAKVRRNNDLVTMFEGFSATLICRNLATMFELIEIGNENYKKQTKDAWEEIGRRMGWL